MGERSAAADGAHGDVAGDGGSMFVFGGDDEKHMNQEGAKKRPPASAAPAIASSSSCIHVRSQRSTPVILFLEGWQQLY